jgi:hypothetical protein
MALDLLEALSLPAGALNEDAFGHGGDAAVVIDGATNLGDALMPGGNDAAWLARFGARRLMAHAGEGKGARKALRDALADTEKSFLALRRAPPEAMWQLPSASMMFVTCTGPSLPLARASAQEGEVAVAGSGASEGRRGALEFLWFGDCAALVQMPDGALTVFGDTLASRAAEAGRARTAPGHTDDVLRHPDVIALLRQGRSRINSGENWRFSPDAAAASHAARQVLPAPEGALVLLASDGFLALVSDYKAYDVEGLMEAACDTGLQALGEELRAIEHNDPRGTQFPRFKPSDDATALLLKVSAAR